jgi:hypothetical protein
LYAGRKEETPGSGCIIHPSRYHSYVVTYFCIHIIKSKLLHAE